MIGRTMPDILILTGPPGSGKSAVAEALGERYDRVAHVQTELLRRFVVEPCDRNRAVRQRFLPSFGMTGWAHMGESCAYF